MNPTHGAGKPRHILRRHDQSVVIGSYQINSGAARSAADHWQPAGGRLRKSYAPRLKTAREDEDSMPTKDGRQILRIGEAGVYHAGYSLQQLPVNTRSATSQAPRLGNAGSIGRVGFHEGGEVLLRYVTSDEQEMTWPLSGRDRPATSHRVEKFVVKSVVAATDSVFRHSDAPCIFTAALA